MARSPGLGQAKSNNETLPFWVVRRAFRHSTQFLIPYFVGILVVCQTPVLLSYEGQKSTKNKHLFAFLKALFPRPLPFFRSLGPSGTGLAAKRPPQNCFRCPGALPQAPFFVKNCVLVLVKTKPSSPWDRA